MKFLEKDLEQIIYEANKELLAERGLYIEGKLYRQLRIGNYGIADLVSYHRPFYNPYEKEVMKGTIVVYELKQEKIGISAFLQALGYLKGIKQFLTKKGSENNYNYKIVLIGKEIDKNSTFSYLSDFIDFQSYYLREESTFNLTNYTYTYNIDGIMFNEESGYYLTDQGF